MSGARYLLDTNIVIGFLAGSAPARVMLERHDANLDNCAVSQITRMELLAFPDLTDSDTQRLMSFFRDVQVVPLNQQVEEAAIALRRSSKLKLPDAIIAATALVHQMRLLTLDDRLAAAVLDPR